MATRIKGFSNNGVKWPGQSNFDKDYVEIEIYDKVVKTGEGENDFTIVKEVREKRTPIADVIAADANSVGVYNIINQVVRTGDTSLLPVDQGNPFVDMVHAPENLMELKAMGTRAETEFNKLPDELTKGMDMKSFVESLTQEQFDSFIKAVADRSSGKVEKKDE